MSCVLLGETKKSSFFNVFLVCFFACFPGRNSDFCSGCVQIHVFQGSRRRHRVSEKNAKNAKQRKQKKKVFLSLLL